MGDKKMTESPHYFVIWEEEKICPDYGGLWSMRTITFDERVACQAFIKHVHKREGYQEGSLRVITGYELEIERD